MTSTVIEFLVKMTCKACVDDIHKSLDSVEGIKKVDINLEKGSVVIESTLSTLRLQELLESTGRPVAVKGYAGSSAGVSILEAGDANVNGVVRFVQATPDVCIIDGTVDGLPPGKHRIAIYECGDISRGCKSIGNIFNPDYYNVNKKVYGDIGKILAERNGRSEFRLEDNTIKLSDVLGRAFGIGPEHNNGEPIACGIVARSAGLFQNPKTICACDGTTIWDEVAKPNSKSNL
ncbi:copper chaperone for superoxide dismutase-like [Sitophilus oryzae]|uniref:superoxide dismutase n=1 Tax=Sitophilus oryzae TaxID=7048 RepID=A0A6J2Y6G9_SITOR|nr:copper chaperone for superoxide dismutase-like [Sitophilus oryzae]